MVEVRAVEVAEFRATEELIREDEKGRNGWIRVENLMENHGKLHGKIMKDMGRSDQRGSKWKDVIG